MPFFLQLSGVVGSATEADHKGWIAIDSASFAVEESRSTGMQQTIVRISRSSNGDSHYFADAWPKAQRFETALLDLVGSDSTQRHTLRSCYVASYQVSTGPNPQDMIELSCDSDQI